MAKKAEIVIPADVLKKTQNKQGIYSQLNRPALVKIGTITEIIQEVFLEYARKHGCKPEQEEIEWQRFKKILLNYL